MKLKLADTFLKLGEIGLETGTPCRIFSVLYNGLTGVPLNLPLSGEGRDGEIRSVVYIVIRVWQTCFQLLLTICLEQVTAIRYPFDLSTVSTHSNLV